MLLPTGERNYQMAINMILDNKKVAEKVIDITTLQHLPIKDLKEYTELVDRPEADINLMEKFIDEIDTKTP